MGVTFSFNVTFNAASSGLRKVQWHLCSEGADRNQLNTPRLTEHIDVNTVAAKGRCLSGASVGFDCRNMVVQRGSLVEEDELPVDIKGSF